MRSTIFTAFALCGFTAGLPQSGPPCTSTGGGAGPVPSDGSVSAYQDTSSSNPLYTNAQGATTPSGYDLSFQDIQAAVQQSGAGYITYKTIASGNYDVQNCADFCNSESNCVAFNIYYERDPSVYPGPNCQNPSPVTNVKCSLYSTAVDTAQATNVGQTQEQFQIVIVGSNGYTSSSAPPAPAPNPNPNCPAAPTVANYNAPQSLPGAINAPSSYIGVRQFGGNFDQTQCTTACTQQAAFAKAQAGSNPYQPCNFVVAYDLYKNGASTGTECAMYTQAWDSSYATNTGYSSGSDTYTVECVDSYTLTTQDPGNGGG